MSDDEKDIAESIEERIARIRRLRGWTSDTREVAVHRDDDVAEHPAERPARVLWLAYRDPSGERKKVAVSKDHFEIGSGDAADLRVLDASISSRHCRIHWDDGGYRVRDMHSKHGTYVNDDVVPLSHALADGDRLKLGDVVFTATLEAPVGAAAAPTPHEATAFIDANTEFSELVAAADGAGANTLHDIDPLAVTLKPGASVEPTTHPRAIAYYQLTWRAADGSTGEARLARGQTLVLGRSPVCDLQVGDKGVSSRHCAVSWGAGQDDVDGPAIVRDLGSTNGTFVNGSRVAKAALGMRDTLHLGRFAVRVAAVAFETPAEAEYREWGDEAEVEVAPPRFHVVFVDDREQVAAVTLGERERQLAVGADNCEILVSQRGLEPEHAVLTWDEGMLAIEARGEAPLAVNDHPETSAVLKNGDVLALADLRMHVVRSMPVAERTAQGPSVEAAVTLWARHLDELDPDLELLFIDPEDHGGRTEVCIWGDGLVQVDRKRGDDAPLRTSGRANRDFMRTLATALTRAGFPDTHRAEEHRSRGADPELHAFRGESRADIVIGRQLALRSGAYAEARDLLRAAADLVGT